jgi:hypothetical protein
MRFLEDLGAIIFIIFSILGIIYTIISEWEHSKWLKENRPPIILSGKSD